MLKLGGAVKLAIVRLAARISSCLWGTVDCTCDGPHLRRVLDYVIDHVILRQFPIRPDRQVGSFIAFSRDASSALRTCDQARLSGGETKIMA